MYSNENIFPPFKKSQNEKVNCREFDSNIKLVSGWVSGGTFSSWLFSSEDVLARIEK